MILEFASSVAMGGLLAGSYFFQNGLGGNDHPKIQRIAKNCGLIAKDGTEIRIYRKYQTKDYTEFVYRMPHGLSSNDFNNKLSNFQDGLNIKRSFFDISLHDIKSINWRNNLITEIKKLVANKKRLNKEVEIHFDGMLRFRVYNEPLSDFVPYDNDMLKSLKGWEIPLGFSRTEFVVHNPDQIPHLIVAGTTRYGKSVFLKNAITTLIHRQPDAATFTLVDLKGGLAFNRFKDAKQVVTVAKNVSETLEALRTVQIEMNSRMEEFLATGYEDIKEAGMKERHFIVVDEAAQLASKGEVDGEIKKMKIECENILSEIARIGGGLGYRIIFATQYPTSDTLRREIKQNCDAKLCFKLQTEVASQVVLDEGGAESLPLIKGRAIYQTDRKRIVQTPFITNEFIDQTIGPHITIKARKDDNEGGTINDAEIRKEATTPRKHTFIVEEIGLS